MKEVTEEDGVEACVWQILVDEQSLFLLQADPEKLHNVVVLELGGGEQQLIFQLMELERLPVACG